MNFLLGLVIGFVLGASKFKTAIVKKTKEAMAKIKKEVDDISKGQ